MRAHACTFIDIRNVETWVRHDPYYVSQPRPNSRIYDITTSHFSIWRFDTTRGWCAPWPPCPTSSPPWPPPASRSTRRASLSAPSPGCRSSASYSWPASSPPSTPSWYVCGKPQKSKEKLLLPGFVYSPSLSGYMTIFWELCTSIGASIGDSKINSVAQHLKHIFFS